MSERKGAGLTPEEVFRTPSSVEAEVVCGLLDAHHIEASVASALSPTLFPMRFGQAEFRITVASGQAGRARDLIASHLDERLSPKGAIVVLRARHLCMEMRGVGVEGLTTTVAVRGVLEDARLLEQFFSRQVRP